MTYISQEDFLIKIAEADSVISTRTSFDKYGKNADIDTGSTPEDVWGGGGIYTGHPTGSAEILELFSSDTNDTSAGTGARTIRVYNLLDGTGAEATDQDVILNGTTAVDVHASNTYYRGGTRMKILTAGTGGENAGNITLRHKTTTANIFAVMPIGNNQTAIATYTVPLGKTLYITRLDARMARASGAAGSATMRFCARPHGGVYNTVKNPEISHAAPYVWGNSGAYVFEARTDLKWNCDQVSDNNTIISAEFEGYLAS